jgi:hypothetical protein
MSWCLVMHKEIYFIPSVCKGTNLSAAFPIRNGLKQGDVLSPLLLNFALDYAISRVHVNLVKFIIEQATKTQGEKMYSSTLSLNSALGGCGWSTPCSGRFTPGKHPLPIV